MQCVRAYWQCCKGDYQGVACGLLEEVQKAVRVKARRGDF